MTGKDLSTRLGLAQSAVTDWKAGRSSPTVKHVAKLAEIFGVTTDYIILGKITQPPTQAMGIVGSHNIHNSPVTVVNGSSEPRQLGQIEAEIVKVCENMPIRQKTELLTIAYRFAEGE